MPDRKPNRLAQETSPYLLQHAYNPVDWYAWDQEALDAARSQDKPIFLSVGYSACHWCHVMEHESFEDPHIAQQLNESFVSVKVDREERPDVDEIYMQAVQLFSGGHGGWPMSVFLTPNLEPYFAGTYFPPTDRHGMPGFPTVLRFAADAYRDRPADVARTAQQVVEALRGMAEIAPAGGVPGLDTLDHAFETLLGAYDTRDGGWGGAPKFPHAMGISFLLRYHLRSGREAALDMVRHTLRRMARGGMYDQIGGGFHRYSTDSRWLVPHFEKMLYDNALLARTYLEAYQRTGDPEQLQVVTEILAWAGREMTGPEGGFYSAQDADSEGQEGRFFVWTPGEVASVLGEREGRIACRYWDVGESGNFEHGASILSVPREADVVASELGIGTDELRDVVTRGRRALFEARESRVRPGRDDKVIAAWNGLMCSAFARAYQVLREPEYLRRAEAAARFVLERSPEGLFRTFKDGRAKGHGFLDDHACTIAALLDLYEASFEPRWIEAAERLNEVVLHEFWDETLGGFYYTGTRHEKLLARSRSPFDNATPSGNSVQTSNLLRLALLGGDAGLRARAERTLALLAPNLRQVPSGMAEMLCALDFQLGPAFEIAVAGRGPEAEALVREVHAPFLPRKAVAGWPAWGPPASLAILESRELIHDHPAAYICRNYACEAPVTDPESLRSRLRELGQPTRG